jgi:hypothetical protein
MREFTHPMAARNLFFLFFTVVSQLAQSQESVMEPHPASTRGLVKIHEDGKFQYDIKSLPKSKVMSFHVQVMRPPVVNNTSNNVTYETMYGERNPTVIGGRFGWIPFKGKAGMVSFDVETGISISKGNGVLADGQNSPSQETYTLYMVPVGMALTYRFEYFSRQLIVPYLRGGATAWILGELRDDSRSPKFVTTYSAGGGGGLLISLSRLDPQSIVELGRDYGISDFWLNLEFTVAKGLRANRDFSSATFGAGIFVDY